VIVDSSVWVALVRNEPDAEELRVAVTEAEEIRVSAAAVLETSMVVTPDLHERLDDLLEASGAVVVPFDHAQARVAREAYARFGKGSGSKARLNLGDCFSYALARVTGEPLLFKGDDFRHTDVESAL
jgi:ribonuclease VapC